MLENCLAKTQPTILTKHQFVRLYKEGVFGNAAPTWNTLEEWERSHDHGKFHIRNRIAGGATFYNLDCEEVPVVWRTCGVDQTNLYISSMAPHQHNLIQGEVQQSERHLDLLWTDVPNLPMREALAAKAVQSSGIMAVCLLRKHLCSRSYEWLQYLLEAYPLHVIEFSCFSKCWGTVPKHNTVIWEVRRY